MSFVEQEDIFDVVENYLTDTVKDLTEKTIKDQVFYRMTYEEAMENYVTDKPDLRFAMKFVDLTDVYKESEFAVFKSVVAG
jgi:aspartyl-tRNA synthetase